MLNNKKTIFIGTTSCFCYLKVQGYWNRFSIERGEEEEDRLEGRKHRFTYE
jgi:hypothetical protein